MNKEIFYVLVLFSITKCNRKLYSKSICTSRVNNSDFQLIAYTAVFSYCVRNLASGLSIKHADWNIRPLPLEQTASAIVCYSDCAGCLNTLALKLGIFQAFGTFRGVENSFPRHHPPSVILMISQEFFVHAKHTHTLPALSQRYSMLHQSALQKTTLCQNVWLKSHSLNGNMLTHLLWQPLNLPLLLWRCDEPECISISIAGFMLPAFDQC